MNNINENDYIEEDNEEDEELGIEIPDMDEVEQGKIVLVLEDTFLVRLDSIAQFGENAIDMREVEKFLQKFPKHKDKIDKILSRAKANKSKSDLSSNGSNG